MFLHLFISDKLIVRLRSFSEPLLLAEISHRPRCLLLSGAARRFSFNVFASPPHPHPRWCSLEGLTATHTSWTSSTPSPLCRPLQSPWPTWPSASNEETGVGRRKRSDRRRWRSLHGLVPGGPEDKGKTGNVCQAQGRALTFRCCLFGFLLSFIVFFSSLIFLNKSKIQESSVCKQRVQGTYLVVFRRRVRCGNVLLGLLMSATGQGALQREG